MRWEFLISDVLFTAELVNVVTKEEFEKAMEKLNLGYEVVYEDKFPRERVLVVSFSKEKPKILVLKSSGLAWLDNLIVFYGEWSESEMLDIIKALTDVVIEDDREAKLIFAKLDEKGKYTKMFNEKLEYYMKNYKKMRSLKELLDTVKELNELYEEAVAEELELG